MSARLIFKMELYKFINDKKYLIFAGCLALLNIFVLARVFDGYNQGYGYEGTSSFYAVVFLTTVVLLFTYPFHVLGVDYKNNVMALMMASGVNRTKLYFAKIGAAALSSFILAFVVVIIPFFLILLTQGSIDVFIEGLGYYFKALAYIDVSLFLVFLYLIFAYLTVIVIINTAVIITRGYGKAILLYFGFSIAITIIRSLFLTPFINVYSMSGNEYLLYELIVNIVVSCIFGFISLRQLQKQNL